MKTNRIVLGLAAWALSMVVLVATWGYALKTADARGVVTAPLGLIAFGMGVAVALFVAGIVLLVTAKRSGMPPIIR